MNTESILDFFKNKKILVFGLGRQGGGVGDLRWLAKHGFDVVGTDQQLLDLSDIKVPLTLGVHKEEDILWADIIIKNPAVPSDHPLMLLAQSKGKLITSSIALFVKYSTVPTIGITGTRGKSTTTALISQVLESAYPGQIITGGNIPDTSPLSLFDLIPGKRYAVLELSSFQLSSFHTLKVSPNFSLLTNIYPDHLNRYSSMDEYIFDKSAIHIYQKPGDYYVEYPNPDLVSNWDTPLPGEHNRENIAGMWSIVSKLGVSEEVARTTVKNFHTLSFRLEVVAVKNGVTYVNDTTSTTPTALIKALQAQTKPILLICGGESKQLPLDLLIKEIKTNKFLKKIVLLGSKNIPEFTKEIRSLSSKFLGQVSSMKEAVALASQNAETGDVVLLSPGFASFDLFLNEFDRGRKFNEEVCA